MKWMIFLLTLSLSACAVKDSIPPRQVVVATPHQARLSNNCCTLDVTNTTIHYR